MITHDIPDNSVVVGVPARVIGTFDNYVNKAMNSEQYPKHMKPRGQQVPNELADYMWKQFQKQHK